MFGQTSANLCVIRPERLALSQGQRDTLLVRCTLRVSVQNRQMPDEEIAAKYSAAVRS